MTMLPAPLWRKPARPALADRILIFGERTPTMLG
jgi:hypothetical protein